MKVIKSNQVGKALGARFYLVCMFQECSCPCECGEEEHSVSRGEGEGGVGGRHRNSSSLKKSSFAKSRRAASNPGN